MGNGSSEAGTWQRWAHARDDGMGRVYTSGLVVIVVVVIKQLKHTAREIKQLCGVMTTVMMDVERKVCARGGFDLLGKSGPSGKWNRQLASGPPKR